MRLPLLLSPLLLVGVVDSEGTCASGGRCGADDARDVMIAEIAQGAGLSGADPSDEAAAAEKAVLARGCDSTIAKRASRFLPPMIGSPRAFVTSVSDDDFIAKLESRRWDVVFFAPGACRYSNAGQPIPGANAHTAGWSLAEYRELVREVQGEAVRIVETTREAEIVPKLRAALGLSEGP